MAEPKDKWKMFLQFMHNELGITKDDIKNWIHDAVNEVARRMVDCEYSNFSISKTIEKLVLDTSFFDGKELNNKILREIAKELANRISIKLKD